MHPKLITRSTSNPQVLSENSVSMLDEIARDGARRMIMEALQLEAYAYIVNRRDSTHFHLDKSAYIQV
jgi:hypothetical protein